MKRLFAVYAVLLVFAHPAGFAEKSTSSTPEEMGFAIAQEASRRNEGFGDTTVKIKMELTSAGGRTRRRILTWKILEAISREEGDKSLAIFHEPRDIAGTGFLSYTHITKADDQWLYLPSLKRVKRIASANKASAFVGSEFSYEDLLSDEVEKYTYRWLRDEPCGEWTCFVVQRTPVYENSGYSRQIMWIEQGEYRIFKTEFYDLKKKLKKTLYFDDYRQYLNKFWRAQILRMENIQTGKKTILEFDAYTFQTGLTEQAFSPDALKRIR
jgi:outer membrane lipoprotein-sorting protein